MRRTTGLSTALVIVVLGLLSGGTSVWAQAHPPLEYKGGPVLETFKIYPLYWGRWTPAEIETQQDYLIGLAAYISGVGAPKGQVPMLRQYGVNSASVAARVTANPKAVKALSRADIVNIIKNNAGKLPAFDTHTLIMVFPGKGSTLTTCTGCGYHASESTTAFWAVVPQNAGPTLALVTAHEVFEAATDPAIDNSQGWISHNGSEAVDKCNSAKFPFITLPFGQIPGAADNTEGGTCSTTGYIAAQKPRISVNNNTNACGGTLFVNGSGFTSGEQVHISVTNLQGNGRTIKIGSAVGTAKGENGTINIQIPYSLGFNCAFNVGSVVITIHATDESEQKASAATYIKNCSIEWTACPA